MYKYHNRQSCSFSGTQPYFGPCSLLPGGSGHRSWYELSSQTPAYRPSFRSQIYERIAPVKPPGKDSRLWFLQATVIQFIYVNIWGYKWRWFGGYA